VNVAVVILAVAWGAWIISWFRNRAPERGDSVARFNRHLSVLERARPGVIAPTRTVQAGPHGVHRISSTPQYGRGAAPLPVSPYAAAPTAGLTLAQAYQRRRTILCSLALATAATLVGAVIAGGLLVLVNLVADAMLVTYVVMLAQAQRSGVERRSKVRYLDAGRSRPAEPALVLTSRSAAHGG
jgi:hypothetical protein